MAGGYDLVEHHDKEIRVSTREYWNVHGNGGRVRLVEPDPEVSFATEKKENENADVNEANATLVRSGFIEMM